MKIIKSSSFFKFAENRLDPKIKQKINQEFIRAGLDGNGRFEKPGKILNTIAGVLGRFGFEITDTQDLYSFPENRKENINKSLRINLSAPQESPMSPGPEVSDSQVYVSYQMLEPYKYEAVVYMT